MNIHNIHSPIKPREYFKHHFLQASSPSQRTYVGPGCVTNFHHNLPKAVQMSRAQKRRPDVWLIYESAAFTLWKQQGSSYKNRKWMRMDTFWCKGKVLIGTRNSQQDSLCWMLQSFVHVLQRKYMQTRFGASTVNPRETRNPENLCTFLFLHSTIFFYPVAIFGNSGVDARFVLASAAFAPARHTSQEDPPLGAGERQGSTRVALRIREERDYFQLGGFLWVPISIKKGHINR